MRFAARKIIGRAVAQERDERRDQAAAHDLGEMLVDVPRKKTPKRVHCVLLIIVCAVKGDRNHRRDSLFYEAPYLLYPPSE